MDQLTHRLRAGSVVAATAALLLCAPGLDAQGNQQGRTRRTAKLPPAKSARAFRKLQLSGEEVRANVAKITGRLRWHDHLGPALADGRRSGKPVLWIQALGDLDGFL